MRGQESMVDALMLVLAFSVVIISISMMTNPATSKSEELRYAAEQHQSALSAVMDKFVQLNGTTGAVARGRMADILAFDACLSGCTTQKCIELNNALYAEINRTLSLINKGKRHYILDAGIWRVYDNKSSVCLEDIPLASQDIIITCGLEDTVTLTAVYGTWAIGEDPPESC